MKSTAENALLTKIAAKEKTLAAKLEAAKTAKEVIDKLTRDIAALKKELELAQFTALKQLMEERELTLENVRKAVENGEIKRLVAQSAATQKEKESAGVT